MVPIGDRPILWHLMRYYAHYGHKDFILCLGYRRDVIKDYFLNYNEALSQRLRPLRRRRASRAARPATSTTGASRSSTPGSTSNIGERLPAVRPHLEGEENFLANYADGLTDAPLPTMIDARSSSSDKVASLLCVKPDLHLPRRRARRGRPGHAASSRWHDGRLWINGGSSSSATTSSTTSSRARSWSSEPFQRLIADGSSLAYRHDGFWAPMDTFKDKQMLDALYRARRRPWAVWSRTSRTVQPSTARVMHRPSLTADAGLLGLIAAPRTAAPRSSPRRPHRRHRDRLRRHAAAPAGDDRPAVEVRWVVFSGARRAGATRPARARPPSSTAPTRRRSTSTSFRDGYFPYDGRARSRTVRGPEGRLDPDLVFTHYRDDLHQDHRLLSELTWNTFRDHLVLEYEIPKYDGDLGRPNVFVPLDEATLPTARSTC